MKRYIKLVSIVVITILTIGTFYIQQSVAMSQYPQFVIQTKSGDESVIESLMIDGSVHLGNALFNMLISLEGTEYFEWVSITNQVFRDYYYDADLSRLQKEYRNFMRGKYDDPAKFYEDDHYLIYATIKGNHRIVNNDPGKFDIEIALLDKQTKDKTTMTLPVPNGERYYYMYIEDVQFVNDELVLISNNHVRQRDSEGFTNQNTEMHIYSIDLKTEKLIHEDTIEFQPISEKNRFFGSIYLQSNENQLGANPYAVMIANIEEEIEETDGLVHFEPVDYQIIAYQFATKEQVKLDVSDIIQEGYHPEKMIDHYLYFKKQSEQQVDMIRYNVETKAVDIKQTFDLSTISNIPKDVMENYGGFHNDFSLIHQHRFYFISPFLNENTDATIFVGDIETGEIAYEGVVTLDKNQKIPDEYFVELYYFTLH